MRIYSSIIFFALIFIACGTSTTTTNTNTSTKIAYFYDSAVNGIQYKCGTNILGVTGDANSNAGSFKYQDNCKVEFYIGKIHLGEINGNKISSNSKIFPTNIVNTNTTDTNNTKVVNILRFIQSLDNDNNTNNGIEISQLVRTNLNLTTTNALDLTRTDLNDSILQNAVTNANPTRILISKIKAIAHFEETIRQYVNSTVDTVAPPKPYLTNTITTINNEFTKNKDFEVNGENGSKIFVAFNSDGNTSNLNFIDYNTTILANEKAIINLDFNNTNISYYHYFIRLQDNSGNNSEYLHLTILKDDIPPSIVNNNLVISVLEQQHFIKNVNATDTYDITYEILSSSEDNRSLDYALFQVSTNGNVTFINEPDYDANINAKFKVVVRALDEAKNSTDVLLTITLTNILDNPPEIINNSYSTYLLEELSNNTLVYDINTTLEHNLSNAPDNDLSLSPINFYLHNYTDMFNLDVNTGKLTIKDNTKDLFDYEKNPNSIDLNISVENNNTSVSGHITYLNLNINITNKIDTSPKLLTPQTLFVNEHNNPAIYEISTIQKNTNLSDKNLSMTYSIINGNDGNFTINSTSGVISTTGDTLDFEKTPQYTLTIRATNTWFDNTIHFDDIDLNITINNLIDNAPSIKFRSKLNSIPESTDGNFTIAIIDTNGTIFDQNQTSTYTITNNIPFQIDSSTGIISTSRQLLNDYNETFDNNSVRTFSLNITAMNIWWDGSIHNSNTLVQEINITNVIDNAPILLIPTSNINFDENTSTQIGTSIYQIQKDNNNYDSNIITSYTIVAGNNENKFELNSSTGEIKLKNLLDWETTQSYTLSINAQNIWWDNTEHNSSNINLIIDVNNIIEKAPKITGPSVINIHENIDINEIIGKIEVNSTKKDEQTINNFSISSGNDGNFSVLTTPLYNSSNLPYTELSIASKINYESNNSYLLDINASNSFGSSIHQVQVNVIDDVEKNLPLLIITVEYDDINISGEDGDFADLIFGTEFTQLNDYYNRISKEKFRFSKANESSNYANDGVIKIHLTKNYPTSQTSLKADLRQALINTDTYVDYSIFDTKRNDNIISKDELQILFIIAGGEKTYGDTNLSVKATSQTFSTITMDGVNVASDQGDPFDEFINTFDILDGNFAVVGEKNNDHLLTIGLVAHHLGHTALNFPYLRDTSEASSGIGYFGLMGYGFKGHDLNESNGTTPVNISAYNLLSQGWIFPTTIKESTNNIKLFPSNKGISGFNILKINTSNPQEYYLIENRVLTSTIGYDIGFYGMENKVFNGGLAIWKINTAKNNNRDVNNKLVDFIEYDQDDGLDNSLHFGTSTSLYHANDPTYQDISDFTINNSSLENNLTNNMFIDIGGL